MGVGVGGVDAVMTDASAEPAVRSKGITIKVGDEMVALSAVDQLLDAYTREFGPSLHALPNVFIPATPSVQMVDQILNDTQQFLQANLA